ncbi:RidA family protein [Ottowia thiooxydans]|uniref:2-iminobutanoate/2-iminopropanoate deaminase n=1 Tax=Ottowia thiooxydans TaxID=219182 RepID=A0ABV2Q9B2_9BURK
MLKESIYAPGLARSKSPHAHAVKAAGLVFVSGCAGYDAQLQLALGDFGGQFRQALANVNEILAAAGSSIAKAVKVTVYLDRRADFEEMNAIYKEIFGTDPQSWPARTTVEARLPRKDFLVEVECVAIA